MWLYTTAFIQFLCSSKNLQLEMKKHRSNQKCCVPPIIDVDSIYVNMTTEMNNPYILLNLMVLILGRVYHMYSGGGMYYAIHVTTELYQSLSNHILFVYYL